MSRRVQPFSRSWRSVSLVVALALGVSTATALAHHRTISADPGSVGGIPYAGVPLSSSTMTVPYKKTAGLVVDSQRNPVAGASVVVMLCGNPIAAGMTDTNGHFVVSLPDVSHLALSLPAEGVFDVPVQAGEPVLIVLP